MVTVNAFHRNARPHELRSLAQSRRYSLSVMQLIRSAQVQLLFLRYQARLGLLVCLLRLVTTLTIHLRVALRLERFLARLSNLQSHASRYTVLVERWSGQVMCHTVHHGSRSVAHPHILVLGNASLYLLAQVRAVLGLLSAILCRPWHRVLRETAHGN